MTRLRQPLRRVGARARHWGRHQERCRTAVIRRAQGRCEVDLLYARPLEWHHVFGRSHLVAEPWASLPELCFGLCRGCHRRATDIPDRAAIQLREWLRSQAVERLRLAYAPDWTWPADFEPDPLARLCRLLPELERRWRWDPGKHRLVAA